VLAALATALGLLAVAAPAAAAPRVVGCGDRSDGEFRRGPENVTVGSFTLVGGRSYTARAADWIRDNGYAKMPVLVRPGHRVTLRIPAGLRAHVGLYYGTHGDAERSFAESDGALTFRSCRSGVSRSRLGGREVSFWSGGLVSDGTTLCVPLSIRIDGGPVRRVRLPVGRDC
jgi:hypothetical protein